jgi:hypothetical protein
LPYARILIDEGAEFLFRGGPPRFTAPGSQAAQAIIDQVIRDNSLGARWLSLARSAGNCGTVAAKFGLWRDVHGAERVKVSFLTAPEECRVWTDAHDYTHITMARVQYPFRDRKTNTWSLFREEWTDDEWVEFEPLSVSSAGMPLSWREEQDDCDQWRIAKIRENPFGVIPITLIRNRQVEGSPLGVGDCWGVFRIMDRVALTMHGQDRSNQLHSDPIRVVKNADLENQGPLLPGEAISVRNSDGSGVAADFELVEPSGAARQYVQAYVEKMEDLLYRAVGISKVDTASIANRGNLTRLAFLMTYARTISTTDRKRQAWGPDGLGMFFGTMLCGLNRAGYADARGDVGDAEVIVQWPDYFAPTDADRKSVTDRTLSQLQAGMIAPHAAALRLAAAEGVPAADIARFADEATKFGSHKEK